MESSELLDLLGNENRRRILQLLSYKPCYVTEISEYLSVSPKAVIDHLKLLEQSGLIESKIDERRRKYFYITRNLRIEIKVSPYAFGIKSAYPRPNFKANYNHLDIEKEIEEEDTSSDLTDLLSKIERLEEIENELSMAQRHIQSILTNRMKNLEKAIEKETENKLEVHTITSLLDQPLPLSSIARDAGVTEDVMMKSLERLEQAEMVERHEDRWRVKKKE